MTTLPAVNRSFRNLGRKFKLAIPQIELREGDLTYIAGANGSGKTLYLRTLAGDIIDGADPWPVEWSPPSLRPILVRQGTGDILCKSLTAMENLAIWRRPRGWLDWMLPTHSLRAELDQIEDRVPSLKGTWRSEVATLSGGQQQALAVLSRAQQSGRPLLMDEVTSALDAATTRDLMLLILSLAREPDRWVVISGHNVHEIAEFATRLIVLANGRVFVDITNSDGIRFSVSQIVDILNKAWKSHLDFPVEL